MSGLDRVVQQHARWLLDELHTSWELFRSQQQTSEETMTNNDTEQIEVDGQGSEEEWMEDEEQRTQPGQFENVHKRFRAEDGKQGTKDSAPEEEAEHDLEEALKLDKDALLQQESADLAQALVRSKQDKTAAQVQLFASHAALATTSWLAS